MIELEIQALSGQRQGLLVEVGHFVIANGFTLLRQRLIQDPHGILLTLVVRGPARKRRALQAALEGDERIISFQLAPFVEGVQKPHFAASRALPGHVPAPVPEAGRVGEATTTATSNILTIPAVATAGFDQGAPTRFTSTAAVTAAPVHEATPEPDVEFTLPESAGAPPAPPSMREEPFVEFAPLEPDQVAIDKMLSEPGTEYPQIMRQLLTLTETVPAGARETSLRLAGQRIGRWVFEHEHVPTSRLGLIDAIEQVGLPTLRRLVEIEQDGTQVRIHNSPLCHERGQSGCVFFSGFLEGVLGSVLASSEVTIFPVCCCSYGADDCVLALSD